MKQYNTGKHTWAYGKIISWLPNGAPDKRNLGPCPRCGYPTSNYGGGFSCHKDYCGNSASYFTCSTLDKWPDWWNTDINVFMDGDKWCSTRDGFINLQESDAGFGDTPDEAVKDLKETEDS